MRCLVIYVFSDSFLSLDQVYEKIIEELRHEVDRVTHLYHETATRCEELSVAAAQVDALQVSRYHPIHETDVV